MFARSLPVACRQDSARLFPPHPPPHPRWPTWPTRRSRRSTPPAGAGPAPRCACCAPAWPSQASAAAGPAGGRRGGALPLRSWRLAGVHRSGAPGSCGPPHWTRQAARHVPPPPCRDGCVAAARQPHRGVDHQEERCRRVRRLHRCLLLQRHPGAQVGRPPAPRLPPDPTQATAPPAGLSSIPCLCACLITRASAVQLACTVHHGQCQLVLRSPPLRLRLHASPRPPPAPRPPGCRSIGETVEEVNDSGFNGNVPTLRTQLLADDSMLQVRMRGWGAPGGCRRSRRG